MEILVQLFKKLPPGWPHVGLLGGIVALLFLPNLRTWLRRAVTGKRQLETAKTLLTLRKLQLEVGALREKHPGAPPSVLDPPIEKMLVAIESDEQEVALPWRDRLVLAGAGSAVFLALGLIVGSLVENRGGIELLQRGLGDMLVLVPCVLTASAIPTTTRGASLLYGCAVPALLAAVTVVVRGSA